MGQKLIIKTAKKKRGRPKGSVDKVKRVRRVKKAR